MGRGGFSAKGGSFGEPPKRKRSRFSARDEITSGGTVCPLCPLGYLPAISLAIPFFLRLF